MRWGAGIVGDDTKYCSYRTPSGIRSISWCPVVFHFYDGCSDDNHSVKLYKRCKAFCLSCYDACGIHPRRSSGQACQRYSTPEPTVQSSASPITMGQRSRRGTRYPPKIVPRNPPVAAWAASKRQIKATTVMTSFCLPKRRAEITIPSAAANERRPETTNSRIIIVRATQLGEDQPRSSATGHRRQKSCR